MNSKFNNPASPRWAPPPLPPSASFLIRAPISSDDVSVTSSSSAAELDEEEEEPELDDAGSGPEPEPEPEPEPRPPIVPVARLTRDETETEEEEEEVLDDVDGDGFVVRVRISTDDEADGGGGKNPNLGVDFYTAAFSESSGEESFDEVDGDGYSTGSRVHSRVGSTSSTPRPSTSVVLDEDGEGPNLNSGAGDEKDEILGGGSRERSSVVEGEEEPGNVAGFQRDEVLDGSSIAEKDEILSENLNLSEKDEVLNENSNAGKDEILSKSLNLSDENSNADKDEILNGNSNLSANLGKGGGYLDAVDDEKVENLGSGSAEMDETKEESERIDNAAGDSNIDHELDDKVVDDEKGENLGSGSAEMDETKEESEGIVNAAGDSSLDHELDDKDVDDEKGENLGTGSAEMDETKQESEGIVNSAGASSLDHELDDKDVDDEKGENLGSGSAEMDETKEESEGIDNAASDSNLDHALDDKDIDDEKGENLGSGSAEMDETKEESEGIENAAGDSNLDHELDDKDVDNEKGENLGSGSAEMDETMEESEGINNAAGDSNLDHELDDKDVDDEKGENLGSGSAEMDETMEESEGIDIAAGDSNLDHELDDKDVDNEKGENLGSGSAEIDETMEESEGIDNAAGDSNLDHELDDEDDSIDVAFDESESKADEGTNGGSSSLVDSNMESFAETQISLVEEKAVTISEEAPIESDARPKYADNDDLFGASSKTSRSGEEIQESHHPAKDVEIIDEKVAEGEEGRQISGEQMTTEPIVEDEEEVMNLARAAWLVRAMASSSDGNNTTSMSDVLRTLLAKDLTGLDSVRPLKPVQSLQSRPIISTSSNLAVAGKPDDTMTEEEKKFSEKVELIRVKFLRIVHRLGLSSEDGIANSVLNQLARIEGSKYWMFSYDNEPARMKALELEREGTDKLDFYCNILVIGKAGVGKSAMINSIFEEEKSLTNAFKSETTSVRKIEGVVDGIKIRVLDTPGLRPSILDQASNRKILSSVKKHMKRYPPDIVLYMDRLDTHTRESNDLPLLKSITGILGSSIWSTATIAFTHAAAAPPEGPNGLPLSYDRYVNLRSRVVQQSIGQAAGDMRFTNRVVLVENHPSCRRSRDGQRVLPNGTRWISELLLWCCSSKILSEAHSLPQVQDSSVQIKPRFRSPPIQFFLSSVLESKPHPKLSSDLGGNDDSDIDLADFSDQEDEEDEYDQLPPFRSLTKSQIAKLSKEHKRAYFEEYDYRVKLLQYKLWKEEIRRLKELKKRGKNGQAGPADGDSPEDFDDSPQNVPVPLPDMTLPPSFDCDNPAYLYRFLELNSQFHSGGVLDTNGWDHEYGYDGVTFEKSLAIAARFPATVSISLRKDKKDFRIHLDSSASAKHGERGSSLASFDMQTIGNQMAYFLKGERMFRNLKKNKTTAGVSLTVLGDTVSTGLKLADQFSIGKRVNAGVSIGRVHVKGDVAYGANLEATLLKKDYPIGEALAALGLSLVRHHGTLTYGGTLQSEVPIGRNSKMAIHVGMNSRKSGQITVKTSCSEQHEIALVGLIPLAIYIFRRIFCGESSSEGRNF